MNRKRIFAIGKLVVLFGTPVALVVGLFSCGVYCGVKNRPAITAFEHDWLGMDVAVASAGEGDTPAPPASAPEAPDAKAPAAAAAPSSETPAEDPATEPAKDPGRDPTGDPTKDPATEPAAAPPTAASPPATEPPPPPLAEPTPETRTDPLAGDLATRLALPVTVHVKVLVDDALIDAEPAWIDYVQRTVAAASQTYQKQFGITLQLTSVGRWPIETAGLDADALLADVRSRPREGSDIVVGFTNRPWDDRTAGKADTPAEGSPFNGAYGVVYANPGHRLAHLRTLMHEVGHIFGATDITDPADAGYQAGSWMSYAPSRESDAPWIDADNRRRILERKDKPFVREPSED